MNNRDAMMIAEDLLATVSPACEEGHAVIAGSLRRRKRTVHDVELVLMSRPGRPAPTFGELHTHGSYVEKILYEMEQDGLIHKIKGGLKMKQYVIKLSEYGLSSINPFKIEFYINTPPAQWGVQLVIRTGPAKQNDNFSKWCVTNKSFGGGLPDGYKVKHLGVWNTEQIDSKGQPVHGETPLVMPTEADFLSFLGLDYVEPWDRHAPRT